MIVVAPQSNRTENAQNLAGPLPINPLSRLGRRLWRRQLRQQALQQASPLLQQGGAQGRFDPFRRERRSLFQPLGKDF